MYNMLPAFDCKKNIDTKIHFPKLAVRHQQSVSDRYLVTQYFPYKWPSLTNTRTRLEPHTAAIDTVILHRSDFHTLLEEINQDPQSIHIPSTAENITANLMAICKQHSFSLLKMAS